MAERRARAKAKRKAPSKKRAAKPAKRRAKPRKPTEPAADRLAASPLPEPERVEDSLLAIAQDAVIILRYELRAKAELAVKHPGWMSMTDCIALLRLTAELGDAAKRGQEGGAANYDRLSLEEREQLAALLLKVDYG